MKLLLVLTIDDVFTWIDNNPDEKYMESNGYRFSTRRARIHKIIGVNCVNCDSVGTHYALTKDNGGGLHLDLYGYKNEKPHLMTVDHIIPKSKGGPDHISNYQMMCTTCNYNKKNTYTDEDLLKVLSFYCSNFTLLNKK
jgi:hypothetical protein